MSHCAIAVAAMKMILVLLLLTSSLTGFASLFKDHQDQVSTCLSLSVDQDAHAAASDCESHQDHACFNHCDHGRLFFISDLNIIPLGLMNQFEENYLFTYSFSFREERLRPPLA